MELRKLVRLDSASAKLSLAQISDIPMYIKLASGQHACSAGMREHFLAPWLAALRNA